MQMDYFNIYNQQNDHLLIHAGTERFLTGKGSEFRDVVILRCISWR